MRLRNSGSSCFVRRPEFSHLVTDAGCLSVRRAMTRKAAGLSAKEIFELLLRALKGPPRDGSSWQGEAVSLTQG